MNKHIRVLFLIFLPIKCNKKFFLLLTYMESARNWLSTINVKASENSYYYFFSYNSIYYTLLCERICIMHLFLTAVLSSKFSFYKIKYIFTHTDMYVIVMCIQYSYNSYNKKMCQIMVKEHFKDYYYAENFSIL